MRATLEDIKSVIESDVLTYEQKHHILANLAERMLDPEELLGYTKEEIKAHEEGVICDLNEGIGLYRPRYILPDYNLLVKKGCKFLEIEKPNTLEELINALMIFYKHVPSITSFPVYIGELDLLMEPFITNLDKDFILIKSFLNYIDKVISDSFCHANISSKNTKAGKLILKAIGELNNPTPNITMKLDLENYDSDLLNTALETSLKVAKPSFANDKIYSSEYDDYGIASCYNGLPIAGGGYTLPRIRLGTLVKRANSEKDFFENILPSYIDLMLSIMDKRIKYLVEESNFFKSSFLVKEGFISKDRFIGMFGLIGLSDCVNKLLEIKGINGVFGKSEEADDLAIKILEFIKIRVDKHKGVYTPYTGGKYILHGQVGASLMDEDDFNTPAHRISVGNEPELPEHLNQAAKFHEFFPSGTGDVFRFDQTYFNNINALKDILLGSFNKNFRYLSFYGANSDLVRVTGYLVKRSEVEKLKNNEVVRRSTTAFGKGTNERARVFDRKEVK